MSRWGLPRITGILLGATLITAAVATPPNAVASAGAAADPTTLVDPFVGTGVGGQNVGQVDMFPGAAMPFGMLTFSPETPSRPASGGYASSDTSTIGLSLTHLSGAGCRIEGDVPILPTVGAISADPAAATEPFLHSDEVARPGFYSTKLGPGGQISTSVAVTTRTGIGRFGFPVGQQGNFLFKVGDSQNGDSAAQATVVGTNVVTGSATTGHFCATQQVPEPVFFAAQFDRPFSSFGTWNGSTVTPGARAVDGQRSGAWVSFGNAPAAQIGMKVGISYVSVANAMQNLAAENAGWDLAAVATSAHNAWQSLLSEIQIAGGTHAQQVQFYTALYHVLLDPTVFSDINGQYPGFDRQTHTATAGQVQYANFSGWDIYRSEVPLLAMLTPDRTSQMMQSLVNDAQQGGWLPKWPAGSSYTGMMNGDAADPMIAEAYAFGARNFDTAGALAAMVKGATQVPTPSQLGQGWYQERPQLADYQRLGYVPNTVVNSGSAVANGTSMTLEYATADFAISQFAGALGQGGTASTFLNRSQNWTNLYNVDSGFLQPRDGTGAFPSGNPVTAGLSNFGQSGFQEGNAAQYAFSVPQNLAGVIAAAGGNAAATHRLDQFFTSLNAGPNDPRYWAGNETDIFMPWIYDYAGAPYRTADVVHQVLTSLYSDTPGGEPGNDDLGAMSSWFVMASMGLYPETPGAGVLALTTPMFPMISLRLPHGQVQISAPGVSDTALHVQSLNVNGQPSQRDWVAASALTGNLRLDYAVTSQAAPSWATAAANEPPSFAAGPLRFPTGVVPVDLTTAPNSVRLTAGATTPVTLTFQVGAGAQVPAASGIHSVTWAAHPPSGITFSPAAGTASVANGTATATVSVSAAAGVTQGFDTIPISLSSNPSLPMPTVDFAAVVVGPGTTATVCSTLGSTNVDNGLSQNEENGDGATTPVTVGGQQGRQTVQLVPNDLNMYFRLDPRIAANQRSTAAFTITYFDAGTVSWTLQYDANGGAPFTSALHVTNQNTNTWQSVTVTVPDAGFAQRENGQSDFRFSAPTP
ncbi:MAG TPA: GH92 family glycosyl hydrolase, partial [Pseudonocardiaceae bacterium]